ncbi:hypothetical protein AC35_5287 [Escherichia coli 3-475-03_S3_C2]|nr:hypothetical protein AC35_5287 [Escherichia coli 3-475-03_S3_C2]
MLSTHSESILNGIRNTCPHLRFFLRKTNVNIFYVFRMVMIYTPALNFSVSPELNR